MQISHEENNGRCRRTKPGGDVVTSDNIWLFVGGEGENGNPCDKNIAEGIHLGEKVSFQPVMVQEWSLLLMHQHTLASPDQACLLRLPRSKLCLRLLQSVQSGLEEGRSVCILNLLASEIKTYNRAPSAVLYRLGGQVWQQVLSEIL